ncbi:sigma-70 family RNA polymerase sigma factor [Acidovorax cavernicola]|uniref:Sigma-70 family RNA polymerase sigma factor n=1 Tax=Acidovorax cavernicola TaxID=1675792 RepID=A0A9X8D6E6_9BURK|nr:sigma-70 family RNA polymerase sigma factor [Acidovorax cavernicola]RIX81962.1 sigma-70 family RNA polymerase sigma factor [Acidovorax cavernicola]
MRAVEAEPVLHALLIQALDGDAVAYREFLQRMADHLRKFIGRRLFAWPDDVEDLVQECLLAMHSQRHTYQPSQPVTAWASGIARYKLIDLLRARASREMRHVPIDDWELFAESTTEAHEAKNDVLVLLKDLPERYRLPIIHVKLEGLSIAEAARLLGMSAAAVKVGIHRGLKLLSETMGEASSQH